jgi:ABC-2 type transport system permease protein
MTPLLALIRKDLQLFFTDRRAVIVSFVVPIAIASFFGSVFNGASGTTEPARIAVVVVDRDGSDIAKDILQALETDPHLAVTTTDEPAARDAVRRGTISVGIVIPGGFGKAAGQAFFSGGAKPAFDLLYDPSRTFELAMVRGILAEYVMQSVGKEMFSGAQGRAHLDRIAPEVAKSNMDAEEKERLLQLLKSVRTFYGGPPGPSSVMRGPGVTLPYDAREQPVTSAVSAPYNGYAHAFAGMAIQFLLFAMANLGVEMLVERQQGLWRRVRSAPVSRLTLLAARGISGAMISLLILLVCFAFAMAVFRVRIDGGVAGFIGIAIACSMMASAFGVLVAAIGKTPATARGVTTLAVLSMVMLGGAWVPAFVFPAWLQQVTLFVPVRWAVDGLDAMTWRGVGSSGAITPILVLLGFTATFWVLALARFRWEES